MDDKSSQQKQNENTVQYSSKSQALPRSYSSTNVNTKIPNQSNVQMNKRNTLLPQNEDQQGQKNQQNNKFDKNIMNLDLKGCVMKTQADWIDDVKCSICLQQYNKMKLLTEHHCRYCGNSVCGECSKRTINMQRVCDFCFLKKQLRNQENRRKKFLISKDKGIIQMKDSIQNLEEQSKQLEKQIADQEINFKIEQNKMLTKLSLIQEEVRQSEETLRKRRENNARLKQAVENDASILKEKELENNQIKDQIQALQIDINFKKDKIKMKQQEYNEIFEQNLKQKQAQSFMDLEQSQYNNMEEERIQYEKEKQKVLEGGNSQVKKQMESNLESIREEPQIEQEENENSLNFKNLEKVTVDNNQLKNLEKQQKNKEKNQDDEEDEQEEEFEEYQNEYQDEGEQNQNNNENDKKKKKKKGQKGNKDGCIIF